MFEFNHEFYKVGDIITVCGCGSQCGLKEVRGRIMEIKSYIKKPTDNTKHSFVLGGSWLIPGIEGKTKRISLMLLHDLYIQK